MISQRTERFCIYFNFILRNSDFDFMLYYNLLLRFTPLEMHVRLICAIKFYVLTYLLTYLLITRYHNTHNTRCFFETSCGGEPPSYKKNLQFPL